MRLTDLSIRKLKSPIQGQRTHFDDAPSGFGVRVSQGGAKSFVVMYGKRRQLKTIGRYPDMKLADARREAKRIQGELAFQNMADLSHLPAITFTEAKDRFLDDTKSRTRPKTHYEYQRLLGLHFKYNKQVQEISRHDVMRVVSKLNNTPSEAQHAFVAIRTMMNWCTKHGLVDNSPVPRMTFKIKARSRILTDNELTAVWKRAGATEHPFGYIVQLLILTGQRRSEIGSLRWSWVNSDQIVYPPDFTKNKREHRLPIGTMANDILEGLSNDADLVFPSRDNTDTPFNGWSKCKKRFDEALDMPPYTLHDLRRTYSSNMARLGVPIHVTEKLLNHVSGTVSGITAVYNRHTYMNEMQEAVNLFEKEFESICC